ncbi:hypothetical protein [Phycicoccus jejuensis]|uniref:aggregation-promoting factor C-terminal-like domain-containing protein n=1 Tax=Phycicoccus jejuensis TaxID=367299 RepID=UPI0006914848|nr:hypothetical protein [Phycicoccus jejuensis]
MCTSRHIRQLVHVHEADGVQKLTHSSVGGRACRRGKSTNGRTARVVAAALAARAEALDAQVTALRARADRLATQRATGLQALARARARATAQARRRAAREARAARDRAARGGASTPVVGAGGGSAASAQRTARSLLGAHGWGGDQYGCLVDLWNGESGWSWSATNPSSGAYGIPQALPSWKMASAGSDWLTDPTTQVRWGMDYIQRAYGSPCAAWNAWQARSPHWY